MIEVTLRLRQFRLAGSPHAISLANIQFKVCHERASIRVAPALMRDVLAGCALPRDDSHVGDVRNFFSRLGQASYSNRRDRVVCST